ncbi:MAG TPA: PEP-CTERM sorting domain-containing protein [Desulfatiglandales bacterium]|nr:PEP-CTERM sorting domain-containing protein [Desulfatiglandales bacterium]
MKRFLVFLCAVTLVFGMIGVGEATLISFLHGDSFVGVDDTTGWSTNDSAKNIGTTFTILSGFGTVSSMDAEAPAELTHRGTRGLGIASEEFDEVDSVVYKEKLFIDFNQPMLINTVWVRSLFDGEGTDGAPERGRVNFFLDGVWLNSWAEPEPSYNLTGTELSGPGSFGEVSYAANIIADQIRFVVPLKQDYTAWSEFAVAKLDVSPVPEPATMLLLGVGLIGLGGLGRKRFLKKA